MFPHLPSHAYRQHFDNLLDLYVGMSQCLFEAAQSLTQLNLQLGRDLLAEAGANAGLATGSPAFANYQRRVSEVLSRCHAAASQTAADRMPAVRRSANAMTNELVQAAANQSAHAAEQLARFQPGSQLRH